MKNLVSYLFLFSIIFSCKKNQLGGNAIIEGALKHHANPIGKGTVFIKFNATEFPGKDTSLYDDKIRVDEEGRFQFKVYKGNYYLYGFGYDYTIPPPFIVDNGIPVRVRAKETVKVTIPVTEVH